MASLLLVGAAGPAAAQSAGVSYPKSRALPDVAAWLAGNTPLQLAQVVDVGPAAVTAVTSAAPTGQPRGFLANIASEALDPSIETREQIVSWTIPVEVDCDRRQVRLGDMTGYAARDLRTAPRPVRDADSQWVVPSANAPLGAVLRSLCDRDFARPFAGPAKAAPRVAEAKPGPPPKVVNLQPPKAETSLSAAVEANKPAPPKAAPKPAAPKPAPAIAHGTSTAVVQIGASPSLDDAKGGLARAQKKFATELTGFKAEVVTAQVDGKTVYRAVVSGFRGQGDAIELCKTLHVGGQACFVRP